MKRGDLVCFRPLTNQNFYSGSKYRLDHLDQQILPGTRGLIIGQEVAECPPGDDDPLDEFPYTMFTILTEGGVVTPGWTDNVLKVIQES